MTIWVQKPRSIDQQFIPITVASNNYDDLESLQYLDSLTLPMARSNDTFQELIHAQTLQSNCNHPLELDRLVSSLII